MYEEEEVEVMDWEDASSGGAFAEKVYKEEEVEAMDWEDASSGGAVAAELSLRRSMKKKK